MRLRSADLYLKSDGIIYTNEMIKEWIKLYLPELKQPFMILDGDLPKKEWFTGKRQNLLSEQDGEIRTALAGRLLGITTEHIELMDDQCIHLHVYGDIFHAQARVMLDEAIALAPNYIHLHPNCPQENWVNEFSQYDAGWLHYFHSKNDDNLMRANWIDINSPARMATYAMAGVPMLMHNNKGHQVHHQKYLESHNMAIAIDSFSELSKVFADKKKIREVRESVWNNREIFCFDHYADDLISFFKEVINKSSKL